MQSVATVRIFQGTGKKKHLFRNIYPDKYIRTEVITLNVLIPSIIDCLDRNGAGCKKRSEDTGLKEETSGQGGGF